MKNDEEKSMKVSFTRPVPADVTALSSDATTLRSDSFSVCTCNHHSNGDRKQFTVISMTDKGVYYTACNDKRLITRRQSDTQVTFDSRSVIDHPHHDTGIHSCLRKVTPSPILNQPRDGPQSLEHKAVRFTLNPSYLIYSDTTLTQEDTAILKQLNQMKNTDSVHHNHHRRRRQSTFSGRKCTKINRTKNYFMHPSTLLLFVIFITIIVCIIFAKRRKRPQNIELNLFFALI